jgi:hypothetical protein
MSENSPRSEELWSDRFHQTGNDVVKSPAWWFAKPILASRKLNGNDLRCWTQRVPTGEERRAAPGVRETEKATSSGLLKRTVKHPGGRHGRKLQVLL